LSGLWFGSVGVITAIMTGVISVATITGYMAVISGAMCLFPWLIPVAAYVLAIAAIVAGVFVTAIIKGKGVAFPHVLWVIPSGVPYVR